jgi:hypothetical protein
MNWSAPARPKLNLRFDDGELHHRIKAAAKKARRSQNDEIIVRLLRTFESEEGAAA